MSKNNEFRYVVSSNNSDIDLRLRWTNRCVHIFVHLSQTRERKISAAGTAKTILLHWKSTDTVRVDADLLLRTVSTVKPGPERIRIRAVSPRSRGATGCTLTVPVYSVPIKKAGQEPRHGTGTLRPLVIGPARGLEADHGGRRIHIRNDQWNVLDAKSELQHVFRCRSSQSGETSTAE